MAPKEKEQQDDQSSSTSQVAPQVQQDASEERPYCGFSPGRQRFIMAVVSTAGLLGPLAGGIYLPAIPVLEREFGVSLTAINATVSVFMAFAAVAPLVWAAFADWKGRRPLYVISLTLYLTANILLTALPANFGALVFLRMVQAFGGSAVISLGAGTVADISEPARRGVAMSIFLLGPNLGPTLGPVLGGVITGQASWRWTFGVLAIAVGIILIIIILALPETLRSRVGNGSVYANKGPLLLPPSLTGLVAPESQRAAAPPKPSLAGFWRLFCYPPISISSIYTAMLFATYFSMAVDLPVTLTTKYYWSVTEVGGGYVALGVSIVMGSILGGKFSDLRRARAAKAAEDGKVAPENRLIDQVWGTVACAAGAIMYGWFVEKGIHPAGVLVATFLTGIGMSSVLVVTFAFLTECAPQASAGAMAIEQMMRNPSAAVSAALLTPLGTRMGSGWYFTGFAILDLVLVGSGTLVLALYGPAWRAKSGLTAPPPAKSGTSSPKGESKEKVSEV